jgi:hypothetical protein
VSDAGPAWADAGGASRPGEGTAVAELAAGLTSSSLIAKDLGLPIPLGARIDGVVVQVFRWSDTQAAIYDEEVRLAGPGDASAENRALPGFWPTLGSPATYGGSENPWGKTLSASDVRAPEFGITLRAGAVTDAAALVDEILVFVNFTPCD